MKTRISKIESILDNGCNGTHLPKIWSKMFLHCFVPHCNFDGYILILSYTNEAFFFFFLSAPFRVPCMCNSILVLRCRSDIQRFVTMPTLSLFELCGKECVAGD